MLHLEHLLVCFVDLALSKVTACLLDNCVCKQVNICFKSTVAFPGRKKTGITPTWLIVEKDLDFIEGQSVHVNWDGKKVQAQNHALRGKL